MPDVIEKGPDSPATLTRQGTDAMRVHAKLDAGQSLVVQESYDPAWHAWSAGTALSVHKDAMGFMAIDAPPGQQDITLAFITPLENQVGRILTFNRDPRHLACSAGRSCAGSARA